MPEIGVFVLAADHETFLTAAEDSVVENAGSGVGATAVLGVEFLGTAEGVAVGNVVSNDHSSPGDCIPGIPFPDVPVPNDMDVV